MMSPDTSLIGSLNFGQDGTTAVTNNGRAQREVDCEWIPPLTHSSFWLTFKPA